MHSLPCRTSHVHASISYTRAVYTAAKKFTPRNEIDTSVRGGGEKKRIPTKRAFPADTLRRYSRQETKFLPFLRDFLFRPLNLLLRVHKLEN